MRKLAVLLLFPIVAAAAVHPAVPAPRSKVAIEPVRIAVKPGDPGTIRGVFIIKASPQAISDSRSGGACMVRQFDDAKACANDAECNVSPPPGSGHGYCASGSGPLGAPQGNTCWYKPALPDSQICKKSPTGLPMNTPLYTPWVSVGAKRPVSWRFITCQNVVPLGCAKPQGVPGVDFVYGYSQPRYFPAVPAPHPPGGG